jgi:hypothetical protein
MSLPEKWYAGSASKELAKPFEQQIVEERKARLDPKLLFALNYPSGERSAHKRIRTWRIALGE